MLKVENIVKDYSGHRAVDDVSFEVPEGSVYGLLGPNGAGKTTLIRIINHITAPDTGRVMLDGQPLTAESVRLIGYLPEERGLYKKMRVGDQALFFAQLRGMSRRDAERELRQWFERLDISGWWNKKVEELSKGMAQKVQFISTVLHRPRLLIFDEPFSGFDPINANMLKTEVLRLRDEGATIIFSTHNMSSVEEICDSITLINRGRNVLSGTIDQVRRQYGDDRLLLRYSGSAQALKDAVQPFATVTAEDADTLTIRVDAADSRRTLIAAANQAVDLHSFEPLMPSMDNIFIKAVEASNL